ncbi:Nif3-like dinuclear metal center hexameric protein [Salana multivorans]
MSEILRLSDVVVDLERRYPPAAAASWDTAIGLVVGDPDQSVRRILLAVECTEATAAEAVELSADLLLVHHPFLWGGVTSIAETTTKGRVLTGLVRGGVALYCAHTNADDPPGGVSDSLARTVGLRDIEPLVPSASPAAPEGAGTGRIGSLVTPTTLGAFAEQVASVLPATAQGIRVSGELDAEIATVAVCGGSGDSYLDAARLAGVDAYLTADLRHHPATDFRAASPRPFLLDAAHWASEWVWLPFLAEQLAADAAARGATVEVHVSTLRTDAWSATFGAQG